MSNCSHWIRCLLFVPLYFWLIICLSDNFILSLYDEQKLINSCIHWAKAAVLLKTIFLWHAVSILHVRVPFSNRRALHILSGLIPIYTFFLQTSWLLEQLITLLLWILHLNDTREHLGIPNVRIAILGILAFIKSLDWFDDIQIYQSQSSLYSSYSWKMWSSFYDFFAMVICVLSTHIMVTGDMWHSALRHQLPEATTGIFAGSMYMWLVINSPQNMPGGKWGAPYQLIGISSNYWCLLTPPFCLCVHHIRIRKHLHSLR